MIYLYLTFIVAACLLYWLIYRQLRKLENTLNAPEPSDAVTELIKAQDEKRRTVDEKMAKFKRVYDLYVAKYGDPASRVSGKREDPR